MFTGLIERTGKLSELETRGNGACLRILTSGWRDPLVMGESISVSGVCLTVSEIDGEDFVADVLKETLDLTALSRKPKGSMVNLERALKAGDRMGGHIVSGHVDGTARIAAIRPTGRDHVLRIACESRLMKEIVVKGSVALDGISLTVAATGEDWFDVHIIPTTWRETSLASLKPGAIINIETDIIAKYVRKYTGAGGTEASILEQMKRAGFA